MTIQQRIEHLTQLGKFLGKFDSNEYDNVPGSGSPSLDERMEIEIDKAKHYNGWYTRENIIFSLKQWSVALTRENLDIWLKPYQFNHDGSKTVGIIMAGNIPLVGFHDFISVLLSGNKVLIKQSSNDQRLLPVIVDYLISLDPGYKDLIRFADGRMLDFDAVIATGSNNTSRYFEYYFKDKPSIIRKNRNSIAVLTGDESSTQLEALGNDIFRYFGLGCRNVSKLYVPENYDFDQFYQAMKPWEYLSNHAKYANNYDYNKAVYLMSEFKFLDNGFLVLNNSADFSSPIATLFYGNYSNKEKLIKSLTDNQDRIQCVVSSGFVNGEVSFGTTQQPLLWDYADNVDTLEFLENLQSNVL